MGCIEERLGRVDVFSNRRFVSGAAGAAVASRFAEPITNSLRAARAVRARRPFSFNKKKRSETQQYFCRARRCGRTVRARGSRRASGA